MSIKHEVALDRGEMTGRSRYRFRVSSGDEVGSTGESVTRLIPVSVRKPHPRVPATPSSDEAGEEWEQNDETKQERSFTLKMAGITAASAVVGALVGGFFTFGAAQLQSQRQLDAQLIDTKKQAYASYLADQTDFLSAQNLAIQALSRTPSDNKQQAVYEALSGLREAGRRVAHSDYGVVLVVGEERNVREARDNVTANNNDINRTTDDIIAVFNSGTPLPKDKLDDLRRAVDKESSLIFAFSTAAQKSLLPPHRGIFDVF
ncbi:hypothetical protein EUA04_07885 [Mycolicibacterium obuense]|uniref:Uncharacterized protein n=1 Tax=Mycolicibacterium obuense TaxID=1807 RepID=A0A4R5X8C9_9MYCO|nr:hypothetical protein [Mycolicibacterium obuense]TDL09868.1 hypothetical protein EUA04_07885 [Mycolicibacterium obuense]